MPDVVLTIGLVVLTSPFWISAISKIADFRGAVDEMAATGLPLPTLVALGTIGLQLLAPLMMILGIAPVLASAVIVFFTLSATFIGHAFWRMKGPERKHQVIAFTNNMGLVGGHCIAAIHLF